MTTIATECPVCPKGETLGWARVREVGMHQLRDMNEAGARAEGYENRTQFINAWRKLYGEVDWNEMVVAISFYDVHWSEA